MNDYTMLDLALEALVKVADYTEDVVKADEYLMAFKKLDGYASALSVGYTVRMGGK
jgi:hypothetical protein